MSLVNFSFFIFGAYPLHPGINVAFDLIAWILLFTAGLLTTFWVYYLTLLLTSNSCNVGYTEQEKSYYSLYSSLFSVFWSSRNLGSTGQDCTTYFTNGVGIDWAGLGMMYLSS